jgi:transcription elongation factor Elf1
MLEGPACRTQEQMAYPNRARQAGPSIEQQTSASMNETEFTCPYCAQPNLLILDPSGGRNQTFTTDCEVCCRPIRITVTLDADGEQMIDADAELME